MEETGPGLDRDATILLEEYRYCAESYWRNEEQGEKRVAALIGLATVLGSVFLLSMAGEEVGFADTRVRVAMLASLVLLLLFGRLTFLRIVKRNVDSDRYKDGMARVRSYFMAHGRENMKSYLPFEPYEPRRRRMDLWNLGKGGWLETVSLANAVILGALAALVAVMAGGSVWWALSGLPLAAAAWTLQVGEANGLYGVRRRDSRVHDEAR